MKTYSVDERSYDLAKYFLGYDRTEALYQELAQQIQDCVEDFCRVVECEHEWEPAALGEVCTLCGTHSSQAQEIKR